MLKPAFIDLSHHNTIPSSLAGARNSGIVGVIHKATEGTGFVDSKLTSRAALARDAGLKFGVYHFVRPGKMDQQVDFFLNTVRAVVDDDTLFCLDWEDSGVSLDDAVAFLQRVQRSTGHDPVLYSGNVLKEALNGKADPRISCYRLWLAQYANAPVLPPGWSKFWGWQYTDAGSVPGITPPTDLNAYDGTAAELAADWSGNVDDEPSPAPEPEITITVIVPPGVKVQVIEENADG